MRIDIVTLFPEMCENILNESIIGRARARGYLQVCCHQLRDHGEGVHKRVDDCTFGGGKGMLLMAQPIAKAFDEIIEQTAVRPHIVYMSPRGRVLDQKKVKELAKNENIIVLCGHYEGVDERVLEEYDVEEISIGDFVLTGGELPAVILTDAVARMLPGVLSEDVCLTLCGELILRNVFNKQSKMHKHGSFHSDMPRAYIQKWGPPLDGGTNYAIITYIEAF